MGCGGRAAGRGRWRDCAPGPRPNTGLTLLFSKRLATRDWFVEGVVAPRTDGVLNFGVRGRWHWLYLGYARENDFDFSNIDRSVWIFGYYHDLSGAP